MKYKFKIGDVVYKCPRLVYFAHQNKYRQKAPLTVKGRVRLENGYELYLVVNQDGTEAASYSGHTLTPNRERVLGYAKVVLDQIQFSKDPFTTPASENEPCFTVMGVV